MGGATLMYRLKTQTRRFTQKCLQLEISPIDGVFSDYLGGVDIEGFR